MTAVPVNESALHPTAAVGQDYNPFAPGFQDNPYPFYARARREAPIAYSPFFNVWVVASQELITSVLKQPMVFSSLHNMDNPIQLPAEVEELLQEGYGLVPGLFNNDPPNHTRIKALFSSGFTTKRVAEMEPRIRALAHSMIDQVAAQGKADLMTTLAYPLPMTVIADLLGVPRADMAKVKHWHDTWMTVYDPSSTLEQQLTAARSLVAYQQYYAALIEDRKINPRDDLITAMVQARMPGEQPFTTAEMISQMIILLSAGHETTTIMIGSMLYFLLQHPEQLAALRDNPELMGAAIEETIRFASPVQMEPRTALQDAEVGGVHLPKGTRLHILYGSANRDEAAIDDPDSFNIHREHVSRHMGFGWGIHFCIGAPLARLEARVALEVLLERLPNLRLAPGFTPTYEPSFFFRGPKHLDLEWDV